MTSNFDTICVEKQDYQTSKRLKYLFLGLHFILGLDFGFLRSDSRRSKTVVNIYCLVHGLCVFANVLVYLILNSVDYVILTWLLTLFTQHLLNSVILTLSDSRSFYDLQKSLSSLDSKLNVKIPITLDNKIILICFLPLSYRTIISYFFCTCNRDECVASVIGASIVFFQILANDSLLIVCFFIFYSVYLRLKMFVTFVQNNHGGVLDCSNLYKSLVDMLEKIKKPFDILYAIALIVATPNLILTSYVGLIKMKNPTGHDHCVDFIVRACYCMQDFSLLVAPAISAGLLSSAVQELKVVLHNRLLQERHEEHAPIMESFISYVEARSLQLTVLRVIRLDWSLPVLIANLCITYQIVVVQLTHLY